jgi:outer membrane lipoprotein-sorting protein
MNRFFKFGLSAVAVVLFFNAFAVTESNGQILRDILKRMDLHYKALQTLKADVKREQVNSQLGAVDKYEGNVVMVPGKGRNFSMRLDWSKPKVEVLSVVNGQYVLYVPGIKRAYFGSSDSAKAGGSGGNVLQALSMSEAELKANYNIEYLGQEGISGAVQTWHLKLTPKTKAKYKFSELWVDSDGMPRQTKITASNNDTDTILLTGIKENERIDGKIFEVKVPSGTEKVKQ